MSKTTDLPFDGGAIPTGGGASSDRTIHHLFLRELTITELGQEVSVYALLDLDRPTLVAPNYEPVSAFTLYDWCSRGDVLQVDVAEALETGTNTYRAFFESANVATNSDGSYVDECVIRVDTKLSGTTPKINTRYLHLSQILDESTSISYMCQHTTLNDHVTYGDELRRTGKVHFLKAVYDSQAGKKAPYGYWIVDLEKPNSHSPYGYDYAMADEIIAKLSAGEIFVLSTYGTAPSPEEDLYIMCSSALQSRQGHKAVRIWFTQMFASSSPEYMYFTTIYTPSMYNSEGSENNYPEGRMAILNWRGQQDSRSVFRFMEYTELAEVATSGSYNDLSDKPDIPGATVNVNSLDSNTDTSSFAFVNGHIYHLTVYLQGSGFSINTTDSGIGYVEAYIGTSVSNNHYSCIQVVNIQNGVINTDDIRLHVDWKAQDIEGSSDNKLQVKVMFSGSTYSLVQNNYELHLIGTDFNGT